MRSWRKDSRDRGTRLDWLGLFRRVGELSDGGPKERCKRKDLKKATGDFKFDFYG